MTNQTFEFEIVNDDELKIASGGFVAPLFGGFHAGVMANAVGAQLPKAMNPLEDIGRMLGQKSGLAKE